MKKKDSLPTIPKASLDAVAGGWAPSYASKGGGWTSLFQKLGLTQF